MGYFSQLDYELSIGKEYLRIINSTSDRELPPEESLDEQQSLWEHYGRPGKLTEEETIAVLTDNMKSPAWMSGIKKLTTPQETFPYTYTKKRSNSK